MSPSKSGKNRLFNVLKAYQAYDPAIGYCQGMNFVAALLLQHIPDEEDVFWTMVYLMFEKNLRDIYVDASQKIALLIMDFERYLKKHNRPVYDHLMSEEGFTMEVCFTSQIVTLFIYDCEFEEATRIFEMFLLDGEQVILDLLVTFIEVKTDTILKLYELDLINYLRKDMVTETLREFKLNQIIPKKPKVKLTQREDMEAAYAQKVKGKSN